MVDTSVRTEIARLRTMIHSPELACIFGTAGTSLANVLNDFCSKDDDDLIRISFKNVRFEHHTREILLNIIGRRQGARSVLTIG